MHPLLPVLLAAADGSFPPIDGGVTFHPPLEGGLEAIVAFTGHAHIATRFEAEGLADLKPDGFGRALHPELTLRLAGGGSIGSGDVTMAARGRGGGTLHRRTDLDDHPRVRHARAIRSDVEVFGDEDGLVTRARGLAGRLEIGVETFTPGNGARLIDDALALVEAGEPVFAAVAPGNARSLRAFLKAGFTPIGSEIIIAPRSTLGW